MRLRLVDAEQAFLSAQSFECLKKLKIVSFNINGIRARLETLIPWLKKGNPDVAVFQEIKVQNESFPDNVFKDLGYKIVTNGQKSFNGVAILSKLPFEIVRKKLPGDEHDEQARFLEIICGGKRIICIYLPNGNPKNTEKFSYKLNWMDRLNQYCQSLITFEEEIILLGDFNVIPQSIDCKFPELWKNDALYDDDVRSRFNYLLNIGYLDALRHCNPLKEIYTQWDYRNNAWENDNGVRIDHVLLSPLAADKLKGCWVEHEIREGAKPSDHVPIWVNVDKN